MLSSVLTEGLNGVDADQNYAGFNRRKGGRRLTQ